MRRSRALSIAPGTFFVAQSWADCITNMAGFNLRRAQPPTVEIFVVPGHGAGVGVHAPLGTTQNFPVPVGLLSCDAPVVERAQEILSDYIKFFSLAAGK